jgi:hypothetical protein
MKTERFTHRSEEDENRTTPVATESRIVDIQFTPEIFKDFLTLIKHVKIRRNNELKTHTISFILTTDPIRPDALANTYALLLNLFMRDLIDAEQYPKMLEAFVKGPGVTVDADNNFAVEIEVGEQALPNDLQWHYVRIATWNIDI